MHINSSQQRGSSLIEVLITLLIFTVGMLGLAALQLNALQGSSDSAQRSQSTWVLQDIAERIRANPAGTAAQYAAAPNCANPPVSRCADYYDPATSAKVTAQNCTAAQMAAFDRWESQCSYAGLASNTINGRFTSRDFITPPDNNITLGIVAAGNTITLQGFWLGRAGAGKNTFAPGIPAFEVRR
ncbi:Type IV pilus modification protein PilV [Pseudomonas sp. 9AZ]|uniref:type IV pilus modification protein PilV n=1 Tax=Pseudomonas sp. 9AZ TaxID=2653168 RepID=UPI0012F02040|nr:type IV pilus modification protein PilV [Pseudomonas sp. 9AZ]VXC53453.1 Type IV pilus modification protein PilV [Pseudomonas sp. 9AZ]